MRAAAVQAVAKMYVGAGHLLTGKELVQLADKLYHYIRFGTVPK